jgi:DNA-binding transcriptional LysR family regulator
VEAARRAGSGETDRLRIGFTDSAALSILPRLIRRFRGEYPAVQLELTEASTSAQLLALQRDQEDLVLVRGPLRSRELAVEVVLREALGRCSGRWTVGAASQPDPGSRRLRTTHPLLAPFRTGVSRCDPGDVSSGQVYATDWVRGRRAGVKYVALADAKELAEVVMAFGPVLCASSAHNAQVRLVCAFGTFRWRKRRSALRENIAT